MYEAEITSEGPGRVICQRCKETYEPGTQLHYMANMDRSRPGRHVCQPCYDYYMNKTTTQRRKTGI